MKHQAKATILFDNEKTEFLIEVEANDGGEAMELFFALFSNQNEVAIEVLPRKDYQNEIGHA